MKTLKFKKSPLKVAKIVKAKVVRLSNMTSDELFLHTLKEIGKPSIVRDMVTIIKKGKIITMAKRKLLTKFYASASHLNRDGIIKRTAVNNNMFEYRLKGWKANSHKLAA